MKLDAKVKVLKDKGQLKVGQVISVPIDEDYATDGDDIIQCVEAYFFETYGISMFLNQDIALENYSEICDEMFGG